MSRRNRPSAFEVSFPEQAASYRAARSATPTGAAPASSQHPVIGPSRAAHASGSRHTTAQSTVPSKRTTADAGIGGPVQPQERTRPAEAFYEAPRGLGKPVEDTEDFELPGEDDDNEGARTPIRILTDFTIFDSKHRNILVPLDYCEKEKVSGSQMVAVGMVKVYVADREDEDEGQEDEEEDADHGVQMKLGDFTHQFNYEKPYDPVYIVTKYARYILGTPSPHYSAFYRYWFSDKRVAQMVISTAADPARGKSIKLDGFLEKFKDLVDPFGHTYNEQDLCDAAPTIDEAVRHSQLYPTLSANPLIKAIYDAYLPSALKRLRSQPVLTKPADCQIPATRLVGDPDLAVLKAENQNTTRVTPRIHALAKNLVNESLRIVGRPIASGKKHSNLRLSDLEQLVDRARKPAAKVQFGWNKSDLISARQSFVKCVYVEGKKYEVGDTILLTNDHHPLWSDAGQYRDPLELSPSSTIAEYFWFARIVYLKPDTRHVHVQYFEHSSAILLQELGHPQHLYLLNDFPCSTVDIRDIIGKVNVKYRIFEAKDDTAPDLDPFDFICNFEYNQATGSFTTVGVGADGTYPPFRDPPLPDDCHMCHKEQQRETANECRPTKDENGITTGFAYHDNVYHVGDFVRYYSEEGGPANLGFVTDFQIPGPGHRRAQQRVVGTVVCRKVGRIAQLPILPANVLRDERHIFMTDETVTINFSDLIGVIYVPTVESLKIKITQEEWLKLSPDHFYLKYRFPTMKPKNWSDRKLVHWDEQDVCEPCWAAKIKEVKEIRACAKEKEKSPLRTLDLFGGVGAFSESLAQGSGALKVTHAVELSPSAARTFKRNFPDAIVYNQCANIMLQYMIKTWHKHDMPTPCQLYDEKVEVPAPPKMGDIDVITAGFPCQAHSHMNMYKDVNDVKNNLVLTALSWIDALRPTYAYFENVPGFLSHRLKGVQSGPHKIVGGIEMGGLKLLIRALLDMGYQVRFGNLQAANYGTPQRRIRFFCVAARHDHPLPDLPQPSHAFSGTELKIHLPYTGGPKQTIAPIRVTRGTALHPFVSIADAIEDLPRFDLKHPKKHERPRKINGVEVPVVKCKSGAPGHRCGLRKGVPAYFNDEPKTRYQMEARRNVRVGEVMDLQHFSKCLPQGRLERVLSIGMAAGSDYRSLEPSLAEWQLSNPLSYAALSNFKPGMYGRLDRNGVFSTVVTNVDPTAKQSRVLNPYCKRIVTVRELARAQGFPDDFEFCAIQDKAVTMHRQIGNAVPYPVGRALGRELRVALLKKRQEEKLKSREVIVIEDDSSDDGDRDRDRDMDVVMSDE